MTQPLDLPSISANIGLPLLFTGQAQKEVFINEGLALIDALMPGAISASRNEPPTSPVEGTAYRVTGEATASWAGREDELAIYLAGSWRFVEPQDGMVFFDRAAGALIHFDTSWHTATPPQPLDGGSVVDSEARAAIAALITALENVGIFAKS
jgi:hypothetical protein